MSTPRCLAMYASGKNYASRAINIDLRVHGGLCSRHLTCSEQDPCTHCDSVPLPDDNWSTIEAIRLLICRRADSHALPKEGTGAKTEGDLVRITDAYDTSFNEDIFLIQEGRIDPSVSIQPHLSGLLLYCQSGLRT